MSLLEKAKQIRLGGAGAKHTPEQIELAEAWAMDDVGLGQVMRAMNIQNTSSAYVFLARALKQSLQSRRERDGLPKGGSV